jgi:hypothetical protein
LLYIGARQGTFKTQLAREFSIDDDGATAKEILKTKRIKLMME